MGEHAHSSLNRDDIPPAAAALLRQPVPDGETREQYIGRIRAMADAVNGGTRPAGVELVSWLREQCDWLPVDWIDHRNAAPAAEASTPAKPKRAATRSGDEPSHPRILDRLDLAYKVARDNPLTPSQASALAYVAYRDNGAGCWSSLDTIAGELCMSKRTVHRALIRLTYLGLIRRDSPPARNSTKPVNYRFNYGHSVHSKQSDYGH